MRLGQCLETFETDLDEADTKNMFVLGWGEGCPREVGGRAKGARKVVFPAEGGWR